MQQQTEEWRNLRKQKIGASDAPVIMETSPWKTKYQLWVDKLSFEDHSPTPAMQRGLDLEDTARKTFTEITGIEVFPKIVMHPTIEWMMASLDGMSLTGDVAVEIKCPGEKDHNEALLGKVPEKYYPQLQHQMEVCQLEKVYYFSYRINNPVVIEVFRDDKYIHDMIEKESEFWDCLKTYKSPKLTDRDYMPIRDNQWMVTAQELIYITDSIRHLEKREKHLKGLLIDMCQSRNAEGGGIRATKIIRQGPIDYEKIPELQNVDVEKYRKHPIEYWKFAAK